MPLYHSFKVLPNAKFPKFKLATNRQGELLKLCLVSERLPDHLIPTLKIQRFSQQSRIRLEQDGLTRRIFIATKFSIISKFLSYILNRSDNLLCICDQTYHTLPVLLLNHTHPVQKAKNKVDAKLLPERNFNILKENYMNQVILLKTICS